MFGISDAGLFLGGGNKTSKRILTAKDGVDALALRNLNIGVNLYLASGYTYRGYQERVDVISGSKVIDTTTTSNIITINGSGYLVKCGAYTSGTSIITDYLHLNVDGTAICNSSKTTANVGAYTILLALGEPSIAVGRRTYSANPEGTALSVGVKDDSSVVVRFENSLYIEKSSSSILLDYKVILD